MRQELLMLLPLLYAHYLLCSEFWQKSPFMNSLLYTTHTHTHTHTNHLQRSVHHTDAERHTLQTYLNQTQLYE